MVEHIKETDNLNAGRLKINDAIDAANTAEKNAASALNTSAIKGDEAIRIAKEKGDESISIANAKGDQAIGIATTKGDESLTIANSAKKTAEDVRKEFDQIIQDAGDSNPEIVNARTDESGVKHDTLNTRLVSDNAKKVSKTDFDTFAKTEASTSKRGLMSAGDKTKLDGLVFKETGEVID